MGESIMSSYERDPNTGNLSLIDGMRSLDEVKALMLDLCYPIGSMYISTVNTSPATFLGGTWISHSGYVLRGATSGVTSNDATKTGGADTHTLSASEMPYHRHSIPALSGTASSTGSAHTHTISNVLNFSGNSGSNAMYSTGWAALKASSFSTNSTGAHSHNVSTTANNTGYEGGTNGTTQAHNNLPNYKSVYMWERVS